MIGHPASAYGSAAAAARDASLRLRHHGHGRSSSPRCIQRRTPPSTSISELPESLLRAARSSPPSSPPTGTLLFASDAREDLRRAARASPPPSPPTGTFLFASDAREDLRRLPLHGMDGSPSAPSRSASASKALDRAIRGMARSLSSASTTEEVLQRRHTCREAPSPPLPSPPRGELSSSSAFATGDDLDRAIRGMVSAFTTKHALQRRPTSREAPSPPLPSPPRGELSSASAFDTGDELNRAIRGMALFPSSASTTDEGLQGRRPRRAAPSPRLPSPPREKRPSASSSATREALDRAIHGTGLSPSPPTQEALRLTASSPAIRLHGHGVLAFSPCSPLLTQYPVRSIATMRASLAFLPHKPSDQDISGPVLIITNPEFSGSFLFSPYTMRAFTRSDYPIDTIDVLYPDGYFFLLKEGTRVSIWEIKSETTLVSFQMGVHIEQGYFTGTPSSELTVVLARQRVFAEQIDEFDGEEQGEQDILAEFWLRRSDGSWQQNAVICAHLGMHSLIIHEDSLFWLSDDGTLCSVRQTEEGLFLQEWEGAVEAVDSSFSLIVHLNHLYIVKSGGILPNPAEIYRVVLGDPPVFPESRINGKDVFIVHGKTGFLLPNQTSDCRVFSAPLVVEADCARFSYTHNRHDNIRPCQSEFFHQWCSAAWAMMETTQ